MPESDFEVFQQNLGERLERAEVSQIRCLWSELGQCLVYFGLELPVRQLINGIVDVFPLFNPRSDQLPGIPVIYALVKLLIAPVIAVIVDQSLHELHYTN